MNKLGGKRWIHTFERAINYANDAIDGKSIPCEEKILEANGFRDLENPKFYLNEDDINVAVNFIENVIVHHQGEDVSAVSLRNTPMKLQEWQMFIVVNLSWIL